jgi:hypothetical protein
MAPVISQISVAGRPSRIDFRYKASVKKGDATAVA